MHTPLLGSIMVDMSVKQSERWESFDKACEKIMAEFPECDILGREYIYEPSKLARIGEFIKTLAYVDTLFCATCGDEIDHVYRFIRAIAHAEGKQIIPVSDLTKVIEPKEDA